MRWIAIALVLATACGRVGFGVADGRLVGANGDAPADAPADGAMMAGAPCGSNADCGPCQRCGSDLTCATEPIVALTAGHRSTCFIGAGGSRWCAGINVGLGSANAMPTYPTRIEGEDGWTELSPGYNDNVGVRDGALWEWGGSVLPTMAQALGSYQEISAQLNDHCVLDSSGGATCDGNAEPGTWLNLATGNNDYCGVQKDHSLWCWGDDQDNNLGQGVVTDPYELATPTRVGSGTNWAAADIGSQLACALKLDHTLWCWGGPGQTGTNNIDTAGVPTQISSDTDWTYVTVRWNHACAGKAGGIAYCWGTDEYGLDVLPASSDVLVPTRYPGTYDAFVMGGHHYCAENAGVWTCWGWNAFGQLGVGDTVTRNSPGGPPLCTPGS